MYAKLKAGATGYDLLVPSSYMVSILHERTCCSRSTMRRSRTCAHVDPDYLKPPWTAEMDHSVPYMVGTDLHRVL